MENNRDRENASTKDKTAPDQVASPSEQQTKAKTNPLPADGRQQTDSEEGEMNNGETGVPKTKE